MTASAETSWWYFTNVERAWLMFQPNSRPTQFPHGWNGSLHWTPHFDIVREYMRISQSLRESVISLVLIKNKEEVARLAGLCRTSVHLLR